MRWVTGCVQSTIANFGQVSCRKTVLFKALRAIIHHGSVYSRLPRLGVDATEFINKHIPTILRSVTVLFLYGEALILGDMDFLLGPLKFLDGNAREL